MRNIFVLLDYYIPGFKSGGPLRTIENTVARLGDRFRFAIFTRDRDATDTRPYPGVRVDAWSQVGKAEVYYAGPAGLSAAAIARRAAEARPDALYLNSFFSPLTMRALLLRRLGRLPAVPVIIAPRGEFSPGALRLKAVKKRAFMSVALPLGLYGGLIWQATSAEELGDIRREVGRRAEVLLAPNLPSPAPRPSALTPPKEPGTLRLVFLSRVAEKKNLHFLLEVLCRARGDVELAIYGPVREEAYWRRCQEVIARLPADVRVEYRGPVEHERVGEALAGAHCFVLPTLGENFGHAIYEALAAGCLPLVSDQTPWRDLEARRLGWDLPLEQPDRWFDAIQRCVAMGEAEYRSWSDSARRFAAAYAAAPEAEEANVALFSRATGAQAVPAPHAPAQGRG